MSAAHRTPRPVAGQVYDALLRIAYPRSFRRQFAADMRETFLAEWANARSQGRRAALCCWLVAVWDVLRFGVLARATWQITRPAQMASPGPPRRRHGGPSRLLWKLSVRQTLSQPLAAGTTVLVAAVGIATSAGLFAVVDGVLLKALDIPSPERIVAIGTPP